MVVHGLVAQGTTTRLLTVHYLTLLAKLITSHMFWTHRRTCVHAFVNSSLLTCLSSFQVKTVINATSYFMYAKFL